MNSINNKNIKLIATDLDGTLLNDYSEISSYNKKVLNYLSDNCIDIILSTGRTLNGMIRYKKSLKNQDCSIVFNGSIIADKDGKFIYNKPINVNDAFSVIKIYEKYKKNLNLHIYNGDQYIISEDDLETRGYIEKEEINDVIVGINNLDNIEFSKILIIGNRNTLEKIKKEINESLDVHTSFSYITYLEILASGINKGSALEWLCNKKGISRENVIAFGDNYNDIEMIKFAGTGVAMHNAEEELKKHADQICLSNNEDGLGKFLNNFLNLNL